MINRINYILANCTGPILSTNLNVCTEFPNGCTAICDKSDCNGISIILYEDNNCNGNIKSKLHYLPGYCIGDSSFANKYTCNNGQVEDSKHSGSADCSNNPRSTDKYDNGVCSSGYYIYDGCNGTSTISPDSSTTTFTLFGTIIIVFITLISLF